MGGLTDFFSGAGESSSDDDWDYGKLAGGMLGGLATSGGGGNAGFVSMGQDMPQMYMGDTSAAQTASADRFIKNRYKDMSKDGNAMNLIAMLKAGNGEQQQQQNLQLPQSMLNDYMKQLGGY